MERLANADSMLLVNRPQSQAANSFIKRYFGLTTEIPHLFLICSYWRLPKRSHNELKEPDKDLLQYLLTIPDEPEALLHVVITSYSTWSKRSLYRRDPSTDAKAASLSAKIKAEAEIEDLAGDDDDNDDDPEAELKKEEAQNWAYIVETVLIDGFFEGKDIRVITLYKEQANMIRQALWRSGNNKLLRDKGVRDIKVHTVDSMQGSEAKMVILDMVLANKRTGRYGFVANKGRLNVSVSRAKFFHVSSLVIQRPASQRSRTPLLQTARQ